LEGEVSGNKLFLSTFDGSSAYLFTGEADDNKVIKNGKFYSGLKSVKNWRAVRDEKAELPDAYSLTGLKPETTKFDFTFPDLAGNNISLSNPQFKNKVVLVQLLGSWCPNCMDEIKYLVPVYNRLKSRGFEIIGLGYERSKDYERSKKTLQSLIRRFNIPYTVLATQHTTTKEEVLKSLPALNDFKGFPTSILIDRRGQVRKIHTGFSGPGTGHHYIDFQQEFEKNLNDLLSEK
jgi:peroxiredoxin